MIGPLALIVEDVEGGYNVVDSRDGEAVAWRSELESAAAVAAFLNSTYPSAAVAPAWDSLVHEVRMWRIGGEPEVPLHRLEPRVLAGMVPDSIGGFFDHGLWRPAPREEAV